MEKKRERQKLSLNKFACLSLQNHSNCIQLPVEPPPHPNFTHMRVWRGHAAFWSASSCYEIRNCPWGKPGASFSFKHIRLKISHIEVKALQESAFTLQQRMLRYRIQNSRQAEQFVKVWDSVFGQTDYAWQKNPLVWIIHFERTPEPNMLPVRAANKYHNSLALAA